MFARANKYTIITDLNSNIAVQSFVKRHTCDRDAIDLRVYGSLLEDHNLIEISFYSREKRDVLLLELSEALNDCTVRTGKKLIFCEGKAA